MKEMEKVVQEETFEIEVQYCDPDDCLHDCIHSVVLCQDLVQVKMRNFSPF